MSDKNFVSNGDAETLITGIKEYVDNNAATGLSKTGIFSTKSDKEYNTIIGTYGYNSGKHNLYAGAKYLNVKDMSQGAVSLYECDDITVQAGVSISSNSHAADISGVIDGNGFMAADGGGNIIRGYIERKGKIVASQKGSFASGTSGTSENGNTGDTSDAKYPGLIARGIGAHAEGRDTCADGHSAHAEGLLTKATAFNSHAEGSMSQAIGTHSHAEGRNTYAYASRSHAEGHSTSAYGYAAHAEGRSTYANGNYSHSEGFLCSADAESSHTEGFYTNALKYCAHAEGNTTRAFGSASHAEGRNTRVGGSVMPETGARYGGHAEGYNTYACCSNGHAEGEDTKALGSHSHAEGLNTECYGTANHAEGMYNTTYGYATHAEGKGTEANGSYSHAGGHSCSIWSNNHYTIEANGEASFAHGYMQSDNSIAFARIYANGLGSAVMGMASAIRGVNSDLLLLQTGSDAAMAFGLNVKAMGKAHCAVGRFNSPSTDADTHLFTVGKGSFSGRANAFRVAATATYGAGAYNSSGADYAEMFEWEDGNVKNEDRRGRFVTLWKNKIWFSASDDTPDDILGITSADPSVCGDVHDDQWKDMYLRDIFGAPIMEEYEEEYETDDIDENGEHIKATRTQTRQKINPDYDPNQTYIPRSERPEWQAVGLLGKLVMVDDGSAVKGGYVRPHEDGSGRAMYSTKKTRFYCMERLDETHIRVLIR